MSCTRPSGEVELCQSQTITTSASHRTTWHHIASHRIASHRIASHGITCQVNRNERYKIITPTTHHIYHIWMFLNTREPPCSIYVFVGVPDGSRMCCRTCSDAEAVERKMISDEHTCRCCQQVWGRVVWIGGDTNNEAWPDQLSEKHHIIHHMTNTVSLAFTHYNLSSLTAFCFVST